jgi:hypothetical protein
MVADLRSGDWMFVRQMSQYVVVVSCAKGARSAIVIEAHTERGQSVRLLYDAHRLVRIRREDAGGGRQIAAW